MNHLQRQTEYRLNSLTIDNFEPKTRERLKNLLDLADGISELLDNYPFNNGQGGTALSRRTPISKEETL